MIIGKPVFQELNNRMYIYRKKIDGGEKHALDHFGTHAFVCMT
jgi:hypothetical protein